LIALMGLAYLLGAKPQRTRAAGAAAREQTTSREAPL
jgi:hypothetical protein